MGPVGRAMAPWDVLGRPGAARAWPLPVSPLLYFFRSLSFSSRCQEQPGKEPRTGPPGVTLADVTKCQERDTPRTEMTRHT